MKRTKTQKGITLIALIITIVTLLILASVAISSIQNDGILSYTENVANKYNQAQRDEQSVLDQYLGYLKGEEWTIIYDGAGVTDDEGMVIVANEHLFKAGRTYKITVESDEFSGTVETKAILAEAEAGVRFYMLFGVTGGKAVTANSLAEYMNILQNMPEGAVYSIIGGVNISDSSNGNSSAIAVNGACQYKVLKIEEKVEKNTGESELIFEGAVTVGDSSTVLEGFQGEMMPARKYRFELLVDGEAITTDSYTTYVWGSYLYVGGYEVGKAIIIMELNGSYLVSKANGMEDITCVLTAIYDVGTTNTYVEENGFVAVDNANNGEWMLVQTPNTSYVVPETVGGKTISSVWLAETSGRPTFVRPINFYSTIEEYMGNRIIKISSSDLQVVYGLLEGVLESAVPLYGPNTIDLTECGDNLEFTEAILSYLTSYKFTLHVTSAVKANYQDNANIVVP